MPKPTRRDWEAFSVDRVECPVCGKPSRSERGSRAHYLACHGDSPRAERNWNICMMYYEGGCSVAEVARAFRISVGAVSRVLSNVALFQHYYELDPIFLEEPKIISINQRRQA